MKFVLFLSLLIAALVTASRGVLMGFAAGLGAFVALVVLILLLGRWARRPAPAGDGPAAVPLMETVEPSPERAAVEEAPPPDWDAVAPRDSDRSLPRDWLPYPLGGGVTADDPGVSPGRLGRRSYLLPLIPDLGAEPRCWSRSERRWLVDEGARALFAAQLFEDLREALGASVADGEADIGWADDDDIARHRLAASGAPLFLAFRSRDARWGGFRHRDEAFRFPLEGLVGLHLSVGTPARGPGNYALEVFAAGDRSRKLQTWLAYRERTSVSLMAMTMQLGRLFDVPVGCATYADEGPTFEETNPYQW